MKKTLLITVLALALVMSSVAIAAAYNHSQIGAAGAKLTDGSTVVVTAQAKPKLTLSIPDSVDFGLVDPETDYSQAMAYSVRSNKPFTVSRAIVGGNPIGLSFTADGTATNAPGVYNLSDTLAINIPITSAADTALSANLQYTVTQN